MLRDARGQQQAPPQRKMPPPGLLSAASTSGAGPSPASLRVGVLGCGKVLFKSWPAIHAAGHMVTFIGSRDVARAESVAREIIANVEAADSHRRKEWAGACQLPAMTAVSPAAAEERARGALLKQRSGTAAIRMPRFGSYEETIAAADVDVVYVTIPVALRDPWVRACIDAGKHVVDEKPAAVSASQLLDWLEGFTRRRLLYIDGTMLTHSDRMHLVREKLRTLGTLKHIDVNLSFLASESFLHEDIRCRTNLEPHGALGDLGWYAIRWILHMVDFAVPSHVSGVITGVTASPTHHPAGGGGAITSFEGHMTFPPLSSGAAVATPAPAATPAPVTASFTCSFLCAYQQTVTLFTSGGVVEVHGAINPTGEDRPHFIVRTCASAHETQEEETNDVARPPAAGTAVSALKKRRTIMKVEKVYSTEAEVDGSQQAVQLWRAVGNCLVCLGVGEPLLMDPEKGKDWGRNAYLTQLVMDKLLESATTTTSNGGCGGKP